MTQLSTVLFRTPVFTASDVRMVQEQMIDVGYQVGSWDNGIGQNWASADSFFFDGRIPSMGTTFIGR